MPSPEKLCRSAQTHTYPHGVSWRKKPGDRRGAKDNSLLLVEFSDLQCPHCKAAQPVITKLLEDFPKARFVFEHFPLPMHPWAFKAAAYAQCIGERDNAAFFKYVDLVFDSQGTISPQGEDADATLKDLAKQAGANPDQIATCAADAGTAESVKQSIALGQELGVPGTPTLFVNGRPVEMGSYSYDTIKEIVAFDAVR
jgi:protein-disulfide isomerase